ncbi:AAEL009417-PA [Aedes aegypti]|uniref:AAEL009417-PA n=1 Tax=Aedes aegypti TaxID=7159 RepID=Q16VX9_AEDAE|nr:AAEL009417-PA [Aedes aegypti]
MQICLQFDYSHMLDDLVELVLDHRHISILGGEFLHHVALLVQLELHTPDGTVVVAVPNELEPVRILLQCFRITDHDQQRFGPRQGHVQPLDVAQEADASSPGTDRGQNHDRLLTALERLYGTDVDLVPAMPLTHLLHLDALLLVRTDDPNGILLNGSLVYSVGENLTNVELDQFDFLLIVVAGGVLLASQLTHGRFEDDRELT